MMTKRELENLADTGDQHTEFFEVKKAPSKTDADVLNFNAQSKQQIDAVLP